MSGLMDNTEYVEDFAARIVRRAGVRVAEAYEGEDLRALAGLARVVDDALVVAVRGMREAGYSWAVIGQELGVTRQAAQLRFSPRMGDGTGAGLVQSVGA
jgi:hypothetical protein